MSAPIPTPPRPMPQPGDDLKGGVPTVQLPHSGSMGCSGRYDGGVKRAPGLSDGGRGYQTATRLRTSITRCVSTSQHLNDRIVQDFDDLIELCISGNHRRCQTKNITPNPAE